LLIANSRYKKIIGYVPQDDIVLPELTVRENILHSARIRLPANWSDHDIQHHVNILISCLQLSHVQDSLVGSNAAPVISGGQRKRVSIGIELAAVPMALFLDEPTSGLDVTAAASIMATLKALSRLGMTIVTTIHQPRQEIFESLDSLVLLGAGRMIYTGPETGIQPHFEALGFTFPDHTNPADAMGDIIAGEGRHYKPKGDASVQGLIDHWASR
jgi:ABC-type multidrug transport system ATPase subunit